MPIPQTHERFGSHASQPFPKRSCATYDLRVGRLKYRFEELRLNVDEPGTTYIRGVGKVGFHVRIEPEPEGHEHVWLASTPASRGSMEYEVLRTWPNRPGRWHWSRIRPCAHCRMHRFTIDGIAHELSIQWWRSE